MPGRVPAGTIAATNQRAEAASSTELYAFTLPCIDVLDEAQSTLMENGTVFSSEEHAFAGEDSTNRFIFVIAASPSKSNPNECYLWIDVSLGEDRITYGTASPRDESRAFMSRLGVRLHTVPKFVKSRK